MEGGDSDKRRNQIHEFTCFTGTTDEDRAITYLEASSWNVSEAVQLFYAEQAAMGQGLDEPRTTASTAEEKVRAPLPTRSERLVDRRSQHEHLLHWKPRRKPIYEAFRDQSAERAEIEEGPNSASGTTGLAKLYKAPNEILYRGGFDDAKKKATEQSLWLVLHTSMVNVQSASEFASHQLNCDTFSNDALKEMIKVNFVFLQTYDTGPTGTRLTRYYSLDKFPCILILDPITGGLMRKFEGFVTYERLTEDMVDFMGCCPSDGSASQLMRTAHKSATAANTVVEPIYSEEQNADTNASESPDSDVMELPRNEIDDDSQGRSVQPDTAIIAKLSEAPPEPKDNTCRVGFILPDGTRRQRLFYNQDTVENLYAFCASEVEEAQRRRFKLRARFPGSQPLMDYSVTVEAAGAQDSVLMLIWDD